MDRSTRLFIAVGLILLALLMGINYAVEQRPILEWLLPIAIAVVGIVVAVLPNWRRPQKEAVAEGPARSYTVQEFVFDRAPQIAAPEKSNEQPGEINVREPEDAVTAAVVNTPVHLPPTGPSDAAVVTTGEPEPKPPEALGQAPAPEPAAEVEAEAVIPAIGEVQTHDPAAHEMPVSEVVPPVPDTTPAERVEADGTMLQPADTAENEFQSGEHVAANQPTTSAPIPTQTTGEGMGAGVEPIPPEQKEVLDATAANPDATSTATGANVPEVAERVLSSEHSEEEADALAPRDAITPTTATEQAAGTGTTPDDLTQLDGIGNKKASALKNAGIDSYLKLSQASDDDLRAALNTAGIPPSPSLTTWREQAGFLARGDRAGFEALRQSLRTNRKGGESAGE